MSDLTDPSVVVSWTPDETSLPYFCVQIVDPIQSYYFSTVDTFFSITGLTPNTAYSVSVLSFCDTVNAVTSEYSAPVASPTPPLATTKASPMSPSVPALKLSTTASVPPALPTMATTTTWLVPPMLAACSTSTSPMPLATPTAPSFGSTGTIASPSTATRLSLLALLPAPILPSSMPASSFPAHRTPVSIACVLPAPTAISTATPAPSKQLPTPILASPVHTLWLTTTACMSCLRQLVLNLTT